MKQITNFALNSKVKNTMKQISSFALSPLNFFQGQ